MLTWSKKGLTPEAALAQLLTARAEAALSLALTVKECSGSAREEIEVAAAYLGAEIKKGDGLTEIDELRLKRAVKKRARRRAQAQAAAVKVAG